MTEDYRWSQKRRRNRLDQALHTKGTTMHARAAHISRRKLLQIGSVAPLTALLMGGTATRAEIAALASALPKDIEDDLWNKAKGQNGAHEGNFRGGVRILVEYFLAGALDKGLTVPPNQLRYLFVDVAYEQTTPLSKSGDLIAQRSGGWDTYMHATVVCAYMCGGEFAVARPNFSDLATVKPAYATAFVVVQNTMSTLMARALRGRPPGPGGAGC